jgi:protoporphyrinogen oxidase
MVYGISNNIMERFGDQNAKTIIIGAGPAGLTAAYELLDKAGIRSTILEMSASIGGMARTEVFKGNRLDLGGHRFYSKSDRVVSWWLNLLPLQGRPACDDPLVDDTPAWSTGGSHREPGNPETRWIPAPDPEKEEVAMLVRKRRSSILFKRRFFTYPITLNARTLTNLGPWRAAKIMASYATARILPIRPERSLADFLTNRFGRELYRTFFKDYTEKVWGVPCCDLKPEWGAQRIKGLSMTKVVSDAARRLIQPANSKNDKRGETSLIDRFYYPKLGAGQLWEEAAKVIERHGGTIHLQQTITGIRISDSRIISVESTNTQTGAKRQWPCDQVFSSMPVGDLIRSMSPAAPESVKRVAQGLQYRDFIAVGLLAKKVRLAGGFHNGGSEQGVRDQWVYIQEPDIKAGRIQIYNNWSPYMVADRNTVWICVEYFCNEGEAFWKNSDGTLAAYAMEELRRIGALDKADVLDSVVLRVPKAYPSYVGTYEEFQTVRSWTDSISNLFLIGRNGMHRYNNMDHSMLSAMAAVECALEGYGNKDRIWAVDTETDCHEFD